MTTLRIQTVPMRPVFEQDTWGNVVEPAKARAHPFEVTCALALPRRELPFNVIVSVDKTLVPDRKAADAIAFSWLVQELPQALSQGAYWDFFSHTRMSATQAPSEIGPVDRYGFEIDVEISSGIATHASAAIDDVEAIERKFDEAKTRLNDLAFNNYALGFKQSVGEARGLFRTIESVLDASATLGGYTAADARSAMRDYEELARRQVESNHNYQSSLRSLQHFVFGVTLPAVWGRRPTA